MWQHTPVIPVTVEVKVRESWSKVCLSKNARPYLEKNLKEELGAWLKW
jgi:hypothetical protein